MTTLTHRAKNTVLIMASLAACQVLFLNCSTEKLSSLTYAQKAPQTWVDAKVNFCTIPADLVKSNLKFIVLMDNSGSNQKISGNPGTDLNGQRRYTALKSFVNQFDSDDSVFWSLVNFSGGVGYEKKSNLFGTEKDQNFTEDKDEFLNLLDKQQNGISSVDGGWTNYIGALSQAYKIIEDSIMEAKKAETIKSSYYVVFLVSDGIPKISRNTVQTFEQIEGYISGKGRNARGLLDFARDDKQLYDPEERDYFNTNLYVDGVQLHTGFYYKGDQPDTKAITLLEKMARSGNGENLVFSEGEAIDFTQFSIPERIAKHLFRDVWVTNVNAIWSGGTFLPDSDGDGLDDLKEQEMGSDPLNPDSDGNDVNDGVFFNATGHPCNFQDCSQTSQVLECRSHPVDGQGKFLDRDGDLLNSCEEAKLNTNPDNFDSNSDYVPDYFAMRSRLDVIANANGILLDTDQDGVQNYDELKQMSPLDYNNGAIAGLQLQKYQIRLSSEADKQSCYELTVSNIPILSENSLIRAYVLENTALVDEKRFFQVAEKYTHGANTVYFEETDFNLSRGD